jgi:tryptophan-rich sensory protein
MNVMTASPSPMNWGRILGHGFMLFLAQTTVGFFSGLLEPEWNAETMALSAAWMGVAALLTLLACAIVFAHLAFRQVHRPFLHAWLVLATACMMGLLLALGIEQWVFELGDTHVVLAVLEYAVLTFALLAGTGLGRKMRAGQESSHD